MRVAMDLSSHSALKMSFSPFLARVYFAPFPSLCAWNLASTSVAMPV
jgi:hypothetical protein